MTVIKNGSFRLPRTIRQFTRKKSTLPRKVGNVSKNHFLDSFRRGGFTDLKFKKWQKKVNGQASNLIKSGTLRRSIRVKSATFTKIVIGTSQVIYAAIHNYGLKGLAFGRAAFKMPKRQFIGDSQIMDRKIEKEIRKEVNKIF